MLPQFEKHTEAWFENRVGKIIEREASIETPVRVYPVLATRVQEIANPDHAKACYLFHRDYKVNYKELIQ